MPKPVGVIPNPISGKDVRRLTAHANVFDNIEKVNIVKRFGVEEVPIMPDSFGIGRQTLGMVSHLLTRMKVEFLGMMVTDTALDSVRAAEEMGRQG